MNVWLVEFENDKAYFVDSVWLTKKGAEIQEEKQRASVRANPDGWRIVKRYVNESEKETRLSSPSNCSVPNLQTLCTVAASLHKDGNPYKTTAVEALHFCNEVCEVADEVCINWKG